MIWLIIVIIAHLFYAFVFLIDKYIVSRPLPHPVVYAFYVGIMSITIWVIAPFGFYFPAAHDIVLCLLAGVAQVAGWLCFYKALNMGEVSRVVPFVGSFVAIFVLILSSLIIGERLNVQQFVAFALLVLGGLIIAYHSQKPSLFGFGRFRGKKEDLFKSFGIAFVSALFFAIFWVITKYIYLDTQFTSGTIWIRTAVALVALLLLIPKKNRELILKKTEKIRPGTVKIFLAGRLLGVFAAFCMYLAVFLGSVTLANSLEGLQYGFVLLFALIFFRKIPSLKEEFNKETIFQKFAAIILIALGLIALII